jgi:23S rRNA (adenine2503-C2)-methyltransferase
VDDLLPNIVGMDTAGLTAMLATYGEPAYRARQVMDWIYGKGVYTFAEMTNLPVALRNRLAQSARIAVPAVVAVQKAADGTRKYLLQLDDGEQVEAVLISERERLTVCLSSQVGCAIGCALCATGLGGLVRNLTAGEIVGQVLSVQRDAGKRLTNVVLMGMGEPLANYGQVMAALKLLNHPVAVGLGARRFTVSTAGVVPGIRQLAREPLQVNLAVSLHAADDRLRDLLVPINRRYPLAKLLAACQEYIELTGRRITFEYVLLAGVNDSVSQAGQLGRLLVGMLCHVNLIPVNPVSEAGYHRPDDAVTKQFLRALRRHGIEATLRKEKGAGIDAACGQLRVRQMR